MDIDTLTPQLLKTALETFQNAAPLPPEIHALYLVIEAGLTSDGSRKVWLETWAHDRTWERLQHLRQQVGLPVSELPKTPEQIRQQLATDFSTDLPALKAWSALYCRYLSLYIFSAEELAAMVSVVARQMRRHVEAGLRHLTELLQRAEIQAQQRARNVHLRRHIPPPEYARLFGVEPLLEKVQTWFAHPQGPQFISLEGMGGMGKTALAQHLTQLFSEKFALAGLAWISARQAWVTEAGEIRKLDNPARTLEDIITRLTHQLGQEHLAGRSVPDKIEGLKHLLRLQPYLIILDNLENLLEVETLLPALAHMAGPATRFLLTSRYSLRAYPYVQVLPIPELSRLHSQMLVASEVQRRGHVHLVNELQMDRIYQTIGGLPLALKLVAAQLGLLPLENILQNLEHAHQQEDLYRYIYWGIWLQLSDAARQLLFSLILIPDGEDLGWLQQFSGLPETEVAPALEQLLYFSLLEMAGTLDNPLYRLHRLTVNFLNAEFPE